MVGLINYEKNSMSVLGSDTESGMYNWRVKSIYQALDRLGKSQGTLEVTDLIQLGHLDQYHYLGTLACDEGIDILDLSENTHVLDVGSGVGGPARYLAHKTGCQITAVELQEDLHKMAIELTQRVGLSEQINYIAGDVLHIDLEKEKFDHFVSWLVFLHVPDKEKLFSNCFNALKSGGTFLIEDMVELYPFTDKEKDILHNMIFAPYVPDVDTYLSYLENAGFINIEFTDVSEVWTEWVNTRYRKHAENKEENTLLYGDAVFSSRNNLYEETAKLFNSGNLGGMRITGQKPA